MKILIDGQEFQPPEEFPARLREILNFLINRAGSERRVVVQMLLDGREIQGLSASDLDKLDLTFSEKLEIGTRPIEEVSRNVLKECADGISRLIEGFAEATQHIQEGRLSEGMDQAGRALSFWIDLSGGVQSALQGLGLDLSATLIPVRGEQGDEEEIPAGALVERINKLLEETQRAFETEDNLEIGDILEYDLPPLLRDFQSVLYRLVERKAE